MTLCSGTSVRTDDRFGFTGDISCLIDAIFRDATLGGQFKSFTYWNHDSRPHASDLPQQWMKWLQLSRQVISHLHETASLVEKSLEQYPHHDRYMRRSMKRMWRRSKNPYLEGVGCAAPSNISEMCFVKTKCFRCPDKWGNEKSRRRTGGFRGWPALLLLCVCLFLVFALDFSIVGSTFPTGPATYSFSARREQEDTSASNLRPFTSPPDT